MIFNAADLSSLTLLDYELVNLAELPFG